MTIIIFIFSPPDISRTNCGEDEFACSHPHLCLPNIWKCNKQMECPDASDEIGCRGMLNESISFCL